MATLAEVIGLHRSQPCYGICACGDANPDYPKYGTTAEWHREHVAAAVTAHLAEVLGADVTREAVAQAVERRNDEALVGAPRRSDGSVWIDCDYRADADAAIAAIQCTLIGEGL